MTAPLPPAFVGPRPEPDRVLHRPEEPLCVRVSREREDLGRHAQFWHDVQVAESLGHVCSRCAYLETAPHHYNATLGPNSTAIDVGQYANDAGRDLVRRGIWDDDTLLTASQVADKTARGMRGGR